MHAPAARPVWITLVLALFLPQLTRAQEKLDVVTTLPAYQAIARELGGDHVVVTTIARADEDAHFIRPKPSYALMLRKADLFVTTGLDLELWVPVLMDKAANRRIRLGEPGYVSASTDVPLLDVPTTADRSAGDVHIYGNPHIFTSPLNAKIIAGHIAAGLSRVDPANAAAFESNLESFRRRIDQSLYGEELLELLGSDTLDPLLRQGRLIDFLEREQHAGRPLLDRLGGWLLQALPMRGAEIAAYHNNWVYFSEVFGVEVVDFVENKPGIPPSARHVKELVDKIRARQIPVLLAASYYSAQQVRAIAERTGALAVRVPMGPSEGETYFEHVDHLLRELLLGLGS